MVNGPVNKSEKIRPGKPERKTLEEKGTRELEKILDRVFSEYIRLRDADKNGYCRCITCGKWYHWKNIHCGHFISRAVKSVRFDERNAAGQCLYCNSYNQGRHHVYREKLVGIYGMEEVESLEQKARLGGCYDAYQLRELIAGYRPKVKALKKEKCL